MASYAEALKGILTKAERAKLPKSFDIVGDILIFADFPAELESMSAQIASAILKTFPNIKVVCRKAKKYSGEFRTPMLRILGGKRRKETIHKENGVRLKLHVEKVYFSPRLSTERDRISKLVKPGESILVMFSGCGAYPINLAKNTKAKQILGVEINPIAHKYALENIELNKATNVKLYLGDVRLVLPTIKDTFDRVLMPLPKTGSKFLDVAIPKVKKGGTLHFYDFLQEDEFHLASEKILSTCKKLGRVTDILRTVKCGQYGPGKFRVCVDVKIK